VEGALEQARRHYEDGLAIGRALGHRGSVGSILNSLGNVATLEHDLRTARSLLHESLLASREVGDRRRLAFTLSAVGGLAALEGEWAWALRVDAAGRATIETLGASLAPAMRRVYDGLLEPARRRVGAAGQVAAEMAGRALTLEQAIDETLAWLA